MVAGGFDTELEAESYHFRIVMHLAAITSSGYRFSIVAFFAWREIKERGPALSTPQRELFKGKIARILRVVLLVVLDVLYLYCCWATRDSLWENRPHCPAQCVLSSPRSAENSIGAIGDTFFTCFSYCVGIIAVKNILQNKRARRIHRGINYYVNGLGSFRVFGLAIHLTLYIYSMWKIMNDLNGGHTVMLEQGQQEALESEYSMSYGQIVPIFLLILPIIQLLESLSGTPNYRASLAQPIEGGLCHTLTNHQLTHTQQCIQIPKLFWGKIRLTRAIRGQVHLELTEPLHGSHGEEQRHSLIKACRHVFFHHLFTNSNFHIWYHALYLIKKTQSGYVTKNPSQHQAKY